VGVSEGEKDESVTASLRREDRSRNLSDKRFERNRFRDKKLGTREERGSGKMASAGKPKRWKSTIRDVIGHAIRENGTRKDQQKVPRSERGERGGRAGSKISLNPQETNSQTGTKEKTLRWGK